MKGRLGQLDGRRAGMRRRLGAGLGGVLVLLVSAAAVTGPAVTASAATPSVPASSTPQGQRLSPHLTALVQGGSSARAALHSGAALQTGPGELPASGPGSFLRRGSDLVVDVRTTAPAGLAAAAKAGGAQVTAQDGSLATMAVAPAHLEALAASPSVISVSEELTPQLSAAAPPGTASQPADVTPGCPSGTVVSGGDRVLQADLARTTYGVDGTGVKVGVLSDSYNSDGKAASEVADGELPGVGNPCGYTTPVQVLEEDPSSGSDEGREMLQVVHDLAPGAQLLFATAFGGQQDFANQIVALKNAGANVIVDDVTYYSEPMYQDGVIAAAIDQVEAAGVSYFSSAGNETEPLNGKSVGSYEAQAFRPTSCPASVLAIDPGADCHNFNPNPTGTPDPTDGLTLPAGSTISLSLDWNEPEFGVSDDFDLFYLNADGSVALSSRNDNAATGLAYESLVGTANVNVAGSLVIARKSGSGTPSIKWVQNIGGEFSFVEWDTSQLGDVMGPTAYGHNMALADASVAAVPWYDPTTPESFSSQGPARYCWEPVSGTAPSAAMPCQSTTIAFAATDGGDIADGPFSTFFGTSAAAPHAAAVNALMRQAQPCRTSNELLAAEAASGRPVVNAPAPAVNTVGSGLIDAVTAIADLAACPTPTVAPGGGTAVAPTSGTSDLAVSVSLSNSISAPVTVDWTTRYVPGAATSAVLGPQAPQSDYQAVGGTVTFAPGQTSAVVHIPVLADSSPGPDEYVMVSFTNPTNAKMGGFWGLGFGVITNDDPTVVPGQGTVAAPTSGTSDLEVPVTLSSPSTLAVTVDWTTLYVPGAPPDPTLGPEAPQGDYQAVGGTVTFAPGQTSAVVHIPVLADRAPSGEYVVVSFNNPTNAKIGGFWGLGLGGITPAS